MMLFKALPASAAHRQKWWCILPATLLMLFVAQESSRAQTLNLSYKEIDSSGFPKIVSFVNVQDEAGASIPGLTENDFTVTEDGQSESPIDVLEIAEDGESVTVALVLDRSSSMLGQPIEDAKSAASNFVRLLQPGDRAAVVAFNSTVTTAHPFSTDTESLVAAISTIQATSGTSIYDAVIHTVALTSPEAGRRVIILLTDGADTESQNSFDNALVAAMNSGIPVFTIGLSLAQGSPEENILVTLADSTGGRYYRSPTSSDLQQIYAAIAAELRNQYRITYTTHNRTTDGTRRLVRIALQGGGASSDTSSYRAPEYVVTIVPTVTGRVSPAREFTLDYEIPQRSNYLLHRMKSLYVQFSYNTDYLTVKQPAEQNISAGALFGALSERTISSTVDEAKGIITVNLTKVATASLIEGRGKLASITFRASESMPDSTLLSFQTLSHSALDSSDWPIATRAEDLSLRSHGLIVWPGDTNRNGKVELTDVTRLGLYWNIQGGGRPSEQDLLIWKAQLSERYPVAAAAHADAGGDGNVDERDLIPIGLNWGKTKDAPDADGPLYRLSGNVPQGQLHLSLVRTGEPNVYRLSLDYGSSQQEAIYGAMLHIRHRDPGVRITSVSAGDAWPTRPLLISSDDQDRGELCLGLMVTAGSPALEQGGEVLQLLVASDALPDLGQFDLQSAGMVTGDGKVHAIDVAASPNSGSQNMPETLVLDHAYPNPFNPSTTVRYTLPEASRVKFTVYSLQGQPVLRANREAPDGGDYNWTWNGLDGSGQRVSSGIYVIDVEARGHNGTVWRRQQKVTLIK